MKKTSLALRDNRRRMDAVIWNGAQTPA